ncbi:sensor histidine kinase [Micromonospora endophytica]|uniref:histidine kinase n=1 Tax=Micromonospora endophytica TaxID=515350 RepID=A0A2W2CHN1_9ACTN|nr:histidine kinase [Micromonospora endophytica]PZF85066.1 two-component sensor histidine kinase [Micromonospora endophytica]RIW48260.1 two-component sensor histidine kinase [Micromonospora endophytica]BCJ56680.1 two-component sensor histidine kinase [Micromonospora endophytica]
MSASPFRRPWRSVVFDVAVSGVVMLFAVTLAAIQPGRWWATAIGVAMAVALLFRRGRPVPVTVVVALLAFVQVVLGWAPMPYDVAVLIALYSVVKYADRLRDGVIAGIVAAVGVVLAATQTSGQVAWYFTAIYYGLVTGAVWLVALNVRTRRLYVLTLEERAATLEREREAEARAAVAEERTRIARELHDVVAHGMAVMIVQADGARFMIDKSPETARVAVKVVADTGRQALEDMRRLVGVLREPSPPESGAAASAADPADLPGQPAAEPVHRRPAVTELPALLDRFRDAGLRVGYTVTGEMAPLPAALELTVYRLMQEALTNTLKHAGVGAAVHATLTHDADAVELRVIDDGRGGGPVTPAPSGGHGLIGMRERVSVYAGSLTAGPHLAGGWQVHARLPIPSCTGTEVIAHGAARGDRG